MNLVESILTENPCYKEGRKITVKGLMLHSVGVAQPNAMVFVRSWNTAAHDNSCVHAFIDANDGTIYQTLPWDHRGWHAGGSANNTHIGIEMCEPASLKYVSGAQFTCSDRDGAVIQVERTYNAAVELFAMLCKEPVIFNAQITHEASTYIVIGIMRVFGRAGSAQQFFRSGRDLRRQFRQTAIRAANSNKHGFRPVNDINIQPQGYGIISRCLNCC